MTVTIMHPTVNIAKNAALQAGKILLRYFERSDTLKAQRKPDHSLVSEADLHADREITQMLRRSYPDHGILSEESPPINEANHDHMWIIDPLDGSNNFLHGIPHFAISIAYRHKGKLEAGVIYDPLRQEMFCAARGRGAQMNNSRIRIRDKASLPGALISLSGRKNRNADEILALQTALWNKGASLRISGSSALDLAHLSAGRLDGIVQHGLNSWDMAAGILLIQEAGGWTNSLDNNVKSPLDGTSILAASPKLHRLLSKL